MLAKLRPLRRAMRCLRRTVDRYIMLYELIAGESFDFDAEKAAAGFARAIMRVCYGACVQLSHGSCSAHLFVFA